MYYNTFLNKLHI